MRASRSPRAIRRVARVSRLTGSAMRSAIQYPTPAPSSTKSTDANTHPPVELVDLLLDLLLPQRLREP